MTTNAKKSNKTSVGQASLFDLDKFAKESKAKPAEKAPKSPGEMPVKKPAAKPAEKPARNSARKPAEKAPPTELMRVVAGKAPSISKIKRAFSEAEAKKIMRAQPEAKPAEKQNVVGSKTPERQNTAAAKIPEGQAEAEAKVLEGQAAAEAKAEFKKRQRRIKRHVLEMEETNRNRLIFYQSSLDGKFYKALNTSALYYAYRYADRMDRTANVMVDTDRYRRAKYVVSIANIDKFAEQFLELEGSNPTITLEGIYLFPLKHQITDEELTQLRVTEQTKRDKVGNLLKPKRMSQGIYNQILLIVRQLGPRSAEIQSRKMYYRVLGENILLDIQSILAAYSDYTSGRYTKEQLAQVILSKAGMIKAALSILGEIENWGAPALTAAGENINTLENMVYKDLGIGGD